MYVLSLLSNCACLWETLEWNRRAPCCSTFKKFSEELSKVFIPAQPEANASHSLLTLTQGSHLVINYIIELCTAVADSAWNKAALLHAFSRGLSDQLKDALANQELPKTLTALMDLVTCLNSRYCKRMHEKTRVFRQTHPALRLTRSPPAQYPVSELAVGLI